MNKGKHLAKRKHNRTRLFLIPALLVVVLVFSAFSNVVRYGKPPVVTSGYDDNTDYLALMKECAIEGTKSSMALGSIYEEARNMKIDDGNYVYPKTNFFDRVSQPDVVLQKINSYAEVNFPEKAELKIQNSGESGLIIVDGNKYREIMYPSYEEPAYDYTVKAEAPYVGATNYDYGSTYNGGSSSNSGMRSLGYHAVTGYTWTGNPCASGVYPYVGCCACNGLPIGSTVYIPGLGTYTVEDRGGMGDPYAIDIYCSSVSECYALTGSYEIFTY